jgi:hypothetical protein
MLADYMLSRNMQPNSKLSDSMIFDNMLSDNEVLLANLLSFSFFLEISHTHIQCTREGRNVARAESFL